jgi:hypothetical protein
MTFENTPAPQSIEVEVLEVLPQEGAVVIQGPDGLEGKFQVIAPANMSYARQGKATVKFTGENISYLRNVSENKFGGGYKKPGYNPGYQKPAYGGYQRQTYQQPQPANNYANPMVQAPVQAVRQVVLFVEDVKGSSLQNLYNKINSVAKIKATTPHLRVNVDTETIGEGKDKKEVIHMKYDAFIYIDLPNLVSFNSLTKLADEIDKPDEVQDY